MTLRVTKAGPGLSIQDAGRPGYLRYGVSESGPMDWAAHALANRLAGNAPGAPALEIGPGGAQLDVQAALHLAVAGSGFQVVLDGKAMAAPVAGGVAAGQRVEVRPGRAGMWAYLAVSGGIDVRRELGSAACHVRAGLGAAVAEGERLIAHELHDGPAGLLCYADPLKELPSGPLGVVAGPQDHLFSEAMKTRLRDEHWQVSTRADRMGYRLEGLRLEVEGGSDIISEGIVMGSIQVPGDGQPIVLMADRQPTGGYAKIGVVCRADIRRLAQARPRDSVSFRFISPEEALRRLRRVRQALESPLKTASEGLSPERLMRANLISGVTGTESGD